LETFAIEDFTFNNEREAEGKGVKYSGHLQCFCEKETTDGVPSDKLYGADQINICEAIGNLGWKVPTVNYGITVFIIIVNIILTKSTIKFVE